MLLKRFSYLLCTKSIFGDKILCKQTKLVTAIFPRSAAKFVKMKSPKQLRSENRQNQHFKETSSYGTKCPGFLQANIAIIPSKYASDLKQFSDHNSAPCPLLYMSKPGEFTAPTLAADVDIRTDVSTYKVFKDGSLHKTTDSLLEYDLSDMVTFYFGCSFTFENELIKNGIRVKNVDLGRNVAMYVTNIQCHGSGPFSSPLVVSMRPVKVQLLDTVLESCRQCDFCHGSPIHIGNGSEIGVDKLDTVQFGGAAAVDEGEVPVFWACGVTSSLAISRAKFPLSFSHYPGCMFIADINFEDSQNLFSAPQYPKSRAICLNEKTQTYSVISDSAVDSISKVEQEIIADPSNRGIQNLIVPGDFMKASLSLSQSAKAVCIITGFPCFSDDPKEENDGIAGAIAIARALQALSSSVTFLVDKHASPLFHQILHWCHENGLLKHEVPVICLDKSIEPVEHIIDSVTREPRYSHLIAIERPGRNHEGKYCTMRADDISESCDSLDDLFIEARKQDSIVTIGIGDGGNEVGMGKMLTAVKEHVNHGETIGCTVEADYLISCGVSNWGGYAIAGALYTASSCSVHERYRRRGIGYPKFPSMPDFLASKEQEIKLQEFLISIGIRDGFNGRLGMSVDGLDFLEFHCPKIDAIHQICSHL